MTSVEKHTHREYFVLRRNSYAKKIGTEQERIEQSRAAQVAVFFFIVPK